MHTSINRRGLVKTSLAATAQFGTSSLPARARPALASGRASQEKPGNVDEATHDRIAYWDAGAPPYR